MNKFRKSYALITNARLSGSTSRARPVPRRLPGARDWCAARSTNGACGSINISVRAHLSCSALRIRCCFPVDGIPTGTSLHPHMGRVRHIRQPVTICADAAASTLPCRFLPVSAEDPPLRN